MSAATFTCAAAVRDGEVYLGARQQMRQFASQVGDGAELTMTLSTKKQTRSLKQNATLWGPVYDQILTAVMAKAGYRKDEQSASFSVDDLNASEKASMKHLVHYGLLAECFGYAPCPITGRMVPKKTSSEMSVSEMCDYFSWLVEYCAEEKDIQIELPDEFRKKDGNAA